MPINPSGQVVTRPSGRLNPSGHPAVDERFRAQAGRSPDAPALETDTACYTYAQLDAWVDAVAGRLARAGIGPERVVAVALPRSPALVMSLLAVNRTGAAYLPIDPELPPERVAYMLGDAKPAAVLYGDATDWIIERDEAPAGFRIADEPEPKASPSRRAGQGAGGGAGAGDADTPVYVIYTSGSTGRPKGVAMCADAVGNLLAWHCADLATSPGRRVAQFTAIGFDIAAQEIFSTLVSGATLVIPGEWTRRDPWRLVRWLASKKITDLFAPNLVVEAVCATALEHGFVLPDLVHVAQAGEQLTLSEDVRTFFRLRPGRRLHNHYGPTETHAATSYRLPADPDDWPDRAPIGAPIWNTDVHLLDADLLPVPAGADGEVFVTGTAMARGYHRQPGLTADRFVPDPFEGSGRRMYRTGDIARRRADGMLEYLGRADQQVKIRGIRIEVGEIDAAIRSRSCVRDVAIVVRGDGPARRLDAYIVPTPGAEDVVERVRERLVQTLPAVMVPATFTLLPKLPMNSNGKVDRNVLPVPAARSGTRTAVPSAAPTASAVPAPARADDHAGTRTAALSRLFAECMELDTVAADDDFFMLGGHSLSAVKLAARIRSTLGLEVTLADIFRNPSVRRLSAALGERRSAPRPITRGDRDSAPPASFAQERLWILDQFNGPTTLYNVPVVIRLRGPLDVPALRAAINDLLARHEILRTRLTVSDSGLRQEVLVAPDVELRVVTDCSPADAASAVDLAARHIFDLGTEIPFRAHLFERGGEDNILLLLIHHIAVDGWSIKPLAKDLGFAYAARLAGMAPPWRPLPVQYADYAAWQRNLFDPADPAESSGPSVASGLARRQTEYWLTALDGVAELTTSCGDRPRPPVLGPDGDRIEVDVESDLHVGIQAVARRTGCTVFMIVHAVLVILFHRRSGNTDIVLGATVAGRSDGALDDLVGFFVNTLALRVDVSGDPAIGEIIRRVRATDLAALEHQELPFEHVVEALRPARTLSYNPVFQVMLAFQVGRPEPPQMPHLATAVEVRNLRTAKFDLTFELTECFDASSAPDGIVGHVEFSTDLFERDTASAIVHDFYNILSDIAKEPSADL